MTRQQLDEQLWANRVSMLRLAMSILRHPQNAEDAVSAAILQAYRRAETLQNEAAFKPWIMRITANCCYDLLRRIKREKQYQQEWADMEPLLVYTREDSLYELISRLPEEMAQVLTLYYYENFSTTEIAQVLRISGVAVRVRLTRGRKRLRCMLEEDDG